MKLRFAANDLYIGRIEKITNDVNKGNLYLDKSPEIFIFQKIIVNNEIRFKEVFTGLVIYDYDFNNYMVPHIGDYRAFIDYYPELTNTKINIKELIKKQKQLNENKLVRKLTK